MDGINNNNNNVGIKPQKSTSGGNTIEKITKMGFGPNKSDKDWQKKHNDFLEKGKSTWNQKLKKGDRVFIKNKDGNEEELSVNGFWYKQKLQDDDTYEEGKDNNWHDFRGINLVDDKGNNRGNINAFQILRHRRTK